MSIPGSASPLFFTAAADAAAAGPIKSVRFNSADSAYLNRTPSSAGNRKTWTWSGWIKRSELGGANVFFSAAASGGTNGFVSLGFLADDTLLLKTRDTTSRNYGSNAKFRDPSAWYHVVAVIDTANATASERQKLYVNGVEITDLQYSATIPQDSLTSVNNTEEQRIGATVGFSGGVEPDFNGYLADVYLIDGQALDPTSFGAFDDNGVWQAAAYSGTYGTNGFHLFDFANESGIGDDSSGNDNDFTVNNLSTTAGAGNDVLRDVPTNGDSSDDTGAGGEVSGNYCTLNPLQNIANDTFSQGNLQVATNTSNYGTYTSTMATPLSGKWYAEVTIVSESGYTFVGLCSASSFPFTTTKSLYNHDSVAYYGRNGDRWIDGSSATYGATYTTGDIIGIAYDADAGSVAFYKNGSSQGTITSVPVREYFFAGSDFDGGSSCTYVWNFGQRAFAYSAPSGYKALCTTNLPTPTIADGSDYFDATLYTGNGSTQTISGLDFDPDLVWIKERSGTADHALYDTVRTATKQLESNTTTAETTESTGLTAFSTGGFSLGALAQVNTNTDTYVAWTWDGGTSTVSNTDGSITSSVRANASAGFSIVSYTGTGANATIGHGLNAAPEFAIFKVRSTTNNWAVYHKSLGATDQIKLNQTAATSSSASFFQNTEPTSSVISLGADSTANYSSQTMIAYCFAPVAGYSAFGTYTGNGSLTDGPYIHLGFRPAFFLLKSIDTGTYNWHVIDSTRSPSNPVDDVLRPNLSDSEVADYGSIKAIFCANGIKLNADWLNVNKNGDTFIYAAFSENAFSLNGGLAR